MRTRWTGPAILALALGAALAGCGQKGETPSIASANGNATATPTAQNAGDNLTETERRAKFTECMRGQGVEMPDPENGEPGGFVFKFGDQAGGGPDPSKVEAAMQACKKYLPNGGDPPKLSPEQLEQGRKHAQCMRENGVPEFPDPDSSGRIKIEGGNGMNPDNETFKAAEEKCREFRPTGGPGGPGPNKAVQGG